MLAKAPLLSGLIQAVVQESRASPKYSVADFDNLGAVLVFFELRQNRLQPDDLSTESLSKLGRFVNELGIDPKTADRSSIDEAVTQYLQRHDNVLELLRKITELSRQLYREGGLAFGQQPQIRKLLSLDG